MINNKDNLMNFISKCTCSFTTVKYIESILKEKGYVKLEPTKKWNITSNNNYYTILNDSSIIAFKIPSKPLQFNIIISHADTPAFKLKPNGLYSKDNISLFNVMPYGGLLNYGWFDHPMSIAGKIAVRNNNKVITKIIDLEKPMMIIPSVAIHLQANANDNLNINSQDHLQPIIDINNNITLSKILNEKDIIDYELYCYSVFNPTVIGSKNDLLLSPRIDNTTSVYASLHAFLDANSNNINVFATFNHEEIGSMTKEGAESTFLSDILRRISSSLNIDYYSTIQKSVLLSSDNTHAMHPNYREYDDLTGNAKLGKGFTIIYDKNTTNDITLTSKWKDMLDKKRILYQEYTARNDIQGGGTISSIIIKHISIPCVEVGIAQLAMHSSVEVCSFKDIDYLFKAMKAFYLLTK